MKAGTCRGRLEPTLSPFKSATQLQYLPETSHNTWTNFRGQDHYKTNPIKPSFLETKTNPTSSARCHSDRRHATSVPKRRNLLQYSLRIPDHLFSPMCQEIMPCIMQNKPNSRNDKNNATFFSAKDYENKPPRGDSKKQTQSKPIPRPQPVFSLKNKASPPKIEFFTLQQTTESPFFAQNHDLLRMSAPTEMPGQAGWTWRFSGCW